MALYSRILYKKTHLIRTLGLILFPFLMPLWLFNAIKSGQATLLVHPLPTSAYCLMVDASNVAVGGVLQQHINGIWQPISFFSKYLQPTETKYSTFVRELMAMYLSIRPLRFRFEGRDFYVLTDHKPLTYSLSCSPHRYSPREARHLDYISQFTSDIRHIQGHENVVADALSCIELNALPLTPVLDFKPLSDAQHDDPELQTLQSSTSLQLQAVPLLLSSRTILSDISTGNLRPYVPFDHR